MSRIMITFPESCSLLIRGVIVIVTKRIVPLEVETVNSSETFVLFKSKQFLKNPAMSLSFTISNKGIFSIEES